MQRTFLQPLNGLRDTISPLSTCGSALLLGPLYFTFIGAWPAAAILWLASLSVLVLGAYGLALLIPVWIVLAGMAMHIRAGLYRRRGWVEVEAPSGALGARHRQCEPSA